MSPPPGTTEKVSEVGAVGVPSDKLGQAPGVQTVLTKAQTPASKMPMPSSFPTTPSATGRRSPSANGRSVDMAMEQDHQDPQTTIHVHPILNVTVPAQAAPQITNVVKVNPTPVSIENRVVPATVHVGGVAQPAPQLTVEDGPAEFTFKRDGKGNIVSATKKPV